MPLKESIIYDEASNVFCLDFIIRRISRRQCLLCKKNLDKDIGEGKWHVPLCKNHRMLYLNEIQKSNTIERRIKKR